MIGWKFFSSTTMTCSENTETKTSQVEENCKTLSFWNQLAPHLRNISRESQTKFKESNDFLSYLSSEKSSSSPQV